MMLLFKKKTMRADQAKAIPIADYLLFVEGIKPTHQRLSGQELWFHSPLRATEKTPSFKVDQTKNIWFDHGISEGGTIIDLICKLRGVSVREALHILDVSGLKSTNVPFRKTNIRRKAPPSQSEILGQSKGIDQEANKIKDKKTSLTYVINEVTKLQHPALLDYVKSRCIDFDISHFYIDEVTFRHTDKLVEYYALGWKNGEGYEVRNKYFKGFVGTGKSISTMNLDQYDEWLIFEGFIDFLSYLTFLKHKKGIDKLQKGVIILNSTALKKQLIPLISEKHPKTLFCFFDNDDAGDYTLKYYQDALAGQKIVDMRYLYSGYKDVNEWHCENQ